MSFILTLSTCFLHWAVRLPICRRGAPVGYLSIDSSLLGKFLLQLFMCIECPKMRKALQSTHEHVIHQHLYDRKHIIKLMMSYVLVYDEHCQLWEGWGYASGFTNFKRKRCSLHWMLELMTCAQLCNATNVVSATQHYHTPYRSSSKLTSVL